MLPAGLDLGPLTGSVANFAGNRPHRRGLEPNVDVDRPPLIARHHASLDRRHQPGRDQRPAEIVDFGSLESFAAPEPRDPTDVARRELRLAANLYFPEPGNRARLYRQHQPCGRRAMVNDDVLLADVGGCEPLFA